MIHRFVAAAGLLLLVAAGAATAATPAPSAPNPAPSAQEVQSLIDTLQNDRARAGLVMQLRALLAAEHAPAAAATPAAAAQPAGPDDFVAQLSHRLNAVTGELLAGVALVLDAPRLASWARHQIANPAARALWTGAFLDCAVIFAAAAAAEWLTRRLLRGVGRNPRASRWERRALRPLFVAFGLAVEILPVAAFGTAATLAMAVVLPEFPLGRPAITLLVQAIIMARSIIVVAKAVLVPRPAWPSLIPAGEETRNYLLIWVRRLVWWAFAGYGIAGAAWWLGVPGALYALMLKAVALGLATLAAILVLQNRRPVAAWVAGKDADTSGAWHALRGHLSGAWHIVAIVYIGAVFVAYALHHEHGTAYVLRASAESLVAVAAAHALALSIRRLSARGLAVAPELNSRFPLLEQRANRYLPVAIGAAVIAVYAFAAAIVMQAWDIKAFEWLGGALGRHVASAAASSILVLIAAVVAWESFAGAIERHLAKLDHDGAPSRTRQRTLLPLLRTAMACVIVTIAALAILSQIGINIAPLLAGAGVVGVAIGFGSQALIKDIITGLFILAEDQVAVGDIVDLGKEHAGVVEAITIRTIRLRDAAGIVHTVPFSEVTSVKNLTRDFAYAVARVTISYGEDIDRVVDILRGVCDELAEDPVSGPLILDKFDYQGVDSLNDFSVVLLLRVKTLPGKNFAVGRALNRLIKIAFDEHKIASRDPSPVTVAGLSDPARAQLASGAVPALTRGAP